MEDPRVAAIVPVYRRPRLVLEALDSVAAQTRPPARLVVVDDGSGDGTPAAVERWLASRPLPFPAELVRRPHRGAGAARNAGAARCADCDVLAFLDSDDLWHEGYLEHVVAALARSPRAVAAACDKRTIDCRRDRATVERVRRYARRPTRQLFRRGPSGTSNTVLRARAFRAAGGYDPAMRTSEDLHLMLRLSLLGTWACVGGVHVTYRQHAGERSGEEPSLAARYADRRLQRVRVLERFVREEGGDRVLSPWTWRPRLCGKWVRATRHLVSLGRDDEARAGLRRAVRIWPLNPLAWLQLGRLALRRTVRGGSPDAGCATMPDSGRSRPEHERRKELSP